VRRVKKLTAALALAAVASLVPAAADAVAIRREGVMAEEFSAWKGVRVCDEKADGNSVYSLYNRDSGSSHRLENFDGNGTCQLSGTSGNLVSRFKACNNLGARPDPCTGYVER